MRENREERRDRKTSKRERRDSRRRERKENWKDSRMKQAQRKYSSLSKEARLLFSRRKVKVNNRRKEAVDPNIKEKELIKFGNQKQRKYLKSNKIKMKRDKRRLQKPKLNKFQLNTTKFKLPIMKNIIKNMKSIINKKRKSKFIQIKKIPMIC